MAKRHHHVAREQKTSSRKTKKRLEKKAEMLRIKAMKPSERKKILNESK